jgi:hypothetical protein
MYAKCCFSDFHNCCFCGLSDGSTYGDATGVRTLRMQETRVSCRACCARQAGPGALSSPECAAEPPSSLYHDCRSCCPLLGAFVRDRRYRCMNGVATAHILQEWSTFLCYVCYMCVGCHNRVMTPSQGVVCQLYVSWHSIQSDDPVLVAYSNTVYRLQIQV